jgi:hypothetical protein
VPGFEIGLQHCEFVEVGKQGDVGLVERGDDGRHLGPAAITFNVVLAIGMGLATLFVTRVDGFGSRLLVKSTAGMWFSDILL